MKLFHLIVFITLNFSLHSQLKEYSFETLDSLQSIDKKPVCIFVKTSWCIYCNKMELLALKDTNVISLLNKNFYFIKFDAEYKKPIYFNHQKYQYKPTGLNTGIHELAEHLAGYNSKIIFPTLCFLNSENTIIYRYNQYTTNIQLYKMLFNLSI